jgi:soluble lytic murein transglycosylase-like protein
MNTGKTLFAQLMDFLPWSTFDRIVARYGGNRAVRSLPCAAQYQAMAFAQITYRESLRDIEACLSAQSTKLYHMGFRQSVHRSTLADANEARDWRIYTEFAQRLIAHTPGMTPPYAALLDGLVVQALFVHNQDEAALRLAEAALRAQPDGAARAAFGGGLAAWRLDRPARSEQLFRAAAAMARPDAPLTTAARFWVARVCLRRDDAACALRWLHRAALDPDHFYGQLARRMLDEPPAAALAAHPVLGEADIDAVMATREGLTAFALLQAGERARAAAELRQLRVRSGGDPDLATAISLIARQAGLSGFGLSGQAPVAGAPWAALRLPALRPRSGFQIDPALVYALARLESNFDQTAVSQAGARGLMQLMPATASALLGTPQGGEVVRARLHDPAINLELGQRYIAVLAQRPSVDGDLIRLLASYNAGPARLADWLATMRDGGDPLLFIEAIPNRETRRFVRHALAYTWAYAGRLRLATPSLDALADDDFPRFDPSVNIASGAAPTLH